MHVKASAYKDFPKRNTENFIGKYERIKRIKAKKNTVIRCR